MSKSQKESICQLYRTSVKRFLRISGQTLNELVALVTGSNIQDFWSHQFESTKEKWLGYVENRELRSISDGKNGENKDKLLIQELTWDVIKITNLRGPKEYLKCPICLTTVSVSHAFSTNHLLSYDDLQSLSQLKIKSQIQLGISAIDSSIKTEVRGKLKSIVYKIIECMI